MRSSLNRGTTEKLVSELGVLDDEVEAVFLHRYIIILEALDEGVDDHGGVWEIVVDQRVRLRRPRLLERRCEHCGGARGRLGELLVEDLEAGNAVLRVLEKDEPERRNVELVAHCLVHVGQKIEDQLLQRVVLFLERGENGGEEAGQQRDQLLVQHQVVLAEDLDDFRLYLD